MAVIDVAFAFSEFVLRPSPRTEPTGVVASAIVLGVAALVVASRRRPASTPTTRRPGPRRPYLGVQEDGAACLDDLAAAIAGRLGAHLPLALHLSDRVAEVFWSGPPPDPPPPWTARHPGWVWLADPRALGSRVPHTQTAALASFVAAGETASGSLWLNIAAFRAIALIGDSSEVGPFGRNALQELRRRAGERLLDLVVVGGDRPDWMATSIAGEDADRVEVTIRQRGLASRDHGPSSRVTRDDRVAPLIVLVTATVPAATRQRIAAAALDNANVTCVVVGDVAGADLRLRFRDQAVRIPFLAGLPVAPPPAAARREPDSRPDAHARDRAQHPEPTLAEQSAVAPTRNGAVEVQVLGPIAIQGTTRSMTAKSMELVAYLACHHGGVHEDRIKAALWPTQPPRPQTWLNRVSLTRNALGCSPDGAPLLPPFDRGLGRLSPSVRIDVDALVAARSKASHQDRAAATATLARALKLVRGRPYDAARGYEWARTELHLERAERVIVEVAHALVQLALPTGDWRQALWATEIGLLACPTSELLDQDRTQTRKAAGDASGA